MMFSLHLSPLKKLVKNLSTKRQGHRTPVQSIRSVGSGDSPVFFKVVSWDQGVTYGVGALRSPQVTHGKNEGFF